MNNAVLLGDSMMKFITSLQDTVVQLEHQKAVIMERVSLPSNSRPTTPLLARSTVVSFHLFI